MESNQQLDHMQAMLEQLVKMVGHNNAVTEELSQRMDSLETKVDRLDTKMDKLEARVDRLESKMDRLESKVDKLENRLDDDIKATEKGFADVIQMLTVLGEKVDRIEASQNLQGEMLRKLAADTLQHDAEITLLKRAK